MRVRSERRITIRSLSLGFVLILVAAATAALASTSAKCPNVAIGLDRKEATLEQLEREITSQLNACSVSATEQEIQTAARNSLDLLNKAKDPVKGVIYWKTKKFTICVSWGEDKNFCKNH